MGPPPCNRVASEDDGLGFGVLDAREDQIPGSPVRHRCGESPIAHCSVDLLVHTAMLYELKATTSRNTEMQMEQYCTIIRA